MNRIKHILIRNKSQNILFILLPIVVLKSDFLRDISPRTIIIIEKIEIKKLKFNELFETALSLNPSSEK